jgi:peroxiredoxin
MPKSIDSSLHKSRIKRDGLPAGTPAPEFALPGLYGGTFSLRNWKGSKVLLVFVDPACGPCAEIASELQSKHASGANVQIVAISRGELEPNLSKVTELGLTFPILLQNAWEISRDYGIFAFPVAYLIDEQGIIAQNVAVGGEAILRMLRDAKSRIELRLEARLRELESELLKGQEELRTLDQRRQYLIEAILRISGAKQALVELSEHITE